MTKNSENGTMNCLMLLPYMTHDFRSLLAMMKMSAVVIEDKFPELVKGYQLAVEHNLLEKNIKDPFLQRSANNGTKIKDAVKKLSSYLNVLDEGVNTLKNNLRDDEACSINFYLDDVLSQYPFYSESERQLLDITIKTNFDIHYPSFFMKPLLFHLLQIMYINSRSGADSRIALWTDDDNGRNRLHIKTKSTEVSQNVVTYALNQLAIEQQDHHLPGLGFCRLALWQLNGDIISNVVEGGSTEIMVVFPS